MSPPAPMAPFDVFTIPLRGMHLVEASAGTGKTWTLSMLVLRLVLERDWPMSQILVVTFTKAAAAELRARIRLRLSEALDALRRAADDAATFSDAPAPDPSITRLLAAVLDHADATALQLQDRVQRALAEFDEAAVLTIHAFCQRALQESAFAARLPLEYEVQTDDAEQRVSAVADHWRKHIAAPPWPQPVLALLAQSRDNPVTWSKLLKAFNDVPMAQPKWPEGIDAAPGERLATIEARFDALQIAFDAARLTWQADRDAIVSLVEAAAQAKILSNVSYKPRSITSAAAIWDDWFRSGNPVAPIVWTKHAKLFTAAFMKGGKLTAPRHRFFTEADAVQETHQTVMDETRLHRLAMIRSMLTQSSDALRLAKASQRVMTYHDMLTRLHERLQSDTQLAVALRHTFKAALIDEFQDTDALQLAIFQAIYQNTDAPVFLVGDPKQAIYGFRGADVHSYLDARAAATSKGTLQHNQRSTPGMIAALNALFTRHDNPLGDSDLQYHPVQAGTHPRSILTDLRDTGIAARAALDIRALPAMHDGRSLSRREAQQLAVDACAGDIAQTLSAARLGKVLLNGNPLRGGHIAVIVETHRQGRQMRQALALLGVRSVELSRASVLTTAEADELSRVLGGIHHMSQPGLLRAALATELIGVDAATLAATMDEPTFAPSAQAANLDAIVLRLVTWRTDWISHGVAAMLWRMFEEVELARRMLPRPDGERRMTNWLHLLEWLNDAAQTRKSPATLLDWFDAQRAATRESDDVLLRLESDQQLVQIVTVHHAKGLEYPIVYAPLLWSSTKQGSRDFGVTYHDNGRHVIDFRGNFDDNVDQSISAHVLKESNTELLRKIYVSLTRAVHRCVLVVDHECRERSGSRNNASLGSMLNWIVGGRGHALDRWHVTRKEVEMRTLHLAQAWQALATQSHSNASFSVIEAAATAPMALAPEAPPDIVDRRSPGPIAAAWRMGSFSAWMQHEATGEETAPNAEPSAVNDGSLSTSHWVPEADDILNFSRGASAGDAVHALLERADFTQPSTWPRAAVAALQLHPQPQPTATEPAVMLLRMMEQLAATELAPGVRLGDIAPAQRRHEFEFDLSIPHADMRAFAQALADSGLPMPRLSPTVLNAPFRGHLRGVIDLVFEHRGRYHLIDWKSNHLGQTPDAYHDAGMHNAMVKHGYHLQLALYALALQRHLRRVLGPAPARAAWGGAYVLFVRGVRPDWRQADGRPAGVCRQPLDFDQLQALDAQLANCGQATAP